MSEQLSFDRKKGFVALPVEVLDFDLTPGAFRTLAELCRMANTDGFCWPSLEQLSARLGRSRSAISGYIKELRSAGLVATQEQKTANGYNYRLKYEVTFWQAWRASLSAPPARQPERRVQPVVRSVDSKNHIHRNHEGAEKKLSFDHLLSGWASCFKGAPYPSARRPPATALQERTAQALATTKAPVPATEAEVREALGALWRDLRLPSDTAPLAGQTERLMQSGFSRPELGAVLQSIARNWPCHWRQPPTPEALDKLVKGTGLVSLSHKLGLLRGYEKRWRLAEKTLRPPSVSCSVAA